MAVQPEESQGFYVISRPLVAERTATHLQQSRRLGHLRQSLTNRILCASVPTQIVGTEEACELRESNDFQHRAD
jgi:hypothetical protein